MDSSNSPRPLFIRWGAIFLGILTFTWFPVEDRSVVFVLALSAGWCAWAAFWLYRKIDQPVLMSVLFGGAAAGLAVPTAALILTVLKAGIHGHGFVDFTNQQLNFIGYSTPAWIVLGSLAAALIWRCKRR